MPVRAQFEVESLNQSATRAIEVVDPVLVVAGFTGRDKSSVEHHIQELEALGIPRPSRVPALFVLGNWLLQVDPATVEVAGPHTSGEAEPVLIRMPSGSSYVTVGSDHTDRELERTSFGAAKTACPKVVAGRVWPLQEIGDLWDEMVVASYLPDGVTYQREAASFLLPPRETIAVIDATLGVSDRPVVVFLGTVPLLSGLVCSPAFEARLELLGRELSFTYQVRAFDPVDAGFWSPSGGS